MIFAVGFLTTTILKACIMSQNSFKAAICVHSLVKLLMMLLIQSGLCCIC